MLDRNPPAARAQAHAQRWSLWVFAGVLLLAAPTFLIRSDWPLGVDGTYLGLVGLAMLLVRWLPVRIDRGYPVGTLGKAFLLWSLIATLSILLSTLAEPDPSPAIKLIAEHVLVLAIFCAGYFLVRIEQWKPGVALLVAVLWVPVASVAMIDAVIGADMIRRVKALASVNYMAASLAAFAWFLIWRLWYKRPKRRLAAVAEVILLMLCAFGVLFSATRSSFLALGVVTFAVAASRLVKVLNKHTLRRRTVLVTVPLVLVIGLGFAIVVARMTAEVNLTALVSRLELQAVIAAAEQRIGDSWASGLPTDIRMAVVGSPRGYLPAATQSDPGSPRIVHPHNILVSIWRFAGLGSLIMFVGFMIHTVLLLRRMGRTTRAGNRREVLMLSGFVLILFIYSLISGHYTRLWHLYWSLGLLSGCLDQARLVTGSSE